MTHPCTERVYHQYVFMMRNRDDDYDIPPTVVATTSDVEEAVDIAIDADQMIYNDKKVENIRKMGIAQLYMVNDDILVWKTQSRQKKLIIWNLRQYLNRRIQDEFMSVWKAFRRYVDWIDAGFEHDMAPTMTEIMLLKQSMPYEKFRFKKEETPLHVVFNGPEEEDREMTINEMDELFGEEGEEGEEGGALYDNASNAGSISYTPPRSSSPPHFTTVPSRPTRKRNIETPDRDEEMLVRAFKNTRLNNPFHALQDDFEDL